MCIRDSNGTGSAASQELVCHQRANFRHYEGSSGGLCCQHDADARCIASVSGFMVALNMFDLMSCRYKDRIIWRLGEAIHDLTLDAQVMVMVTSAHS